MSGASDLDFGDPANFADLAPDPVAPDRDSGRRTLKSPFVVVIDSNEQQPFHFGKIVGDSRDANARIQVRIVRKRLRTGDYQIEGMPEGIVIERKSLSDLIGSVSPGQRREDFVGRMRRMSEQFKNAAVVVEAYPSELLRIGQGDHDLHGDELDSLAAVACEGHGGDFAGMDDRGRESWRNVARSVRRELFSSRHGDKIFNFTSLNPIVPYRTSLSWSLQFPRVHWHWAEDRVSAADACYRILEKFFEHETSTKYQHHNKPMDRARNAYNEGILARRVSEIAVVPYPAGVPLRLDWEAGWHFASVHEFEGDLGHLCNIGEMPETGAPEPPAAARKKKRRSAAEPDPMVEMRAHFGDALTK